MLFFKQKTAYEMRIGDWSADVCSSDLDKFLEGTGPNPFYVEAYWQIDASASWEFVPGITGFVEGINLTGEGRRGHLRHKNNVTFASPGFARYAAGVRFAF